MGSIGAKKEVPNNITSIVGRANTQTEKSRGWDYRGITETLDKLEAAYNKTNSTAKIASIYTSLKNQDNVISEELKSGDGDKSILMAQRRRVRQLIKKVAKGK